MEMSADLTPHKDDIINVTCSILTCSDERPSAAKTPDYAALIRRLEMNKQGRTNMTIKLTGKLATIVEKILGYHQDGIGVLCWTPNDEQFLLDAEMNYFKTTGSSIYETKDCPIHFKIDAINFRERVKLEL